MVSFFALLDDISLFIKNTSIAFQTASQKTVAILGDDLAVNAEKSSQFDASKELFAIKKIAIGALKNKLIILPFVFFFSYFMPILIHIALIIGALYLSYEGIQSIIESFEPNEENTFSFKEQISNAIKIDFILSIEIVVIAFSSVFDKPFSTQVTVVSLISFLAVFFIYGIVAFIVRLDDMGYYLYSKGFKKIGLFFVESLFFIVKALKIIGIIAMFLVSGSILNHSFGLYHLEGIVSYIANFGLGFVVGLFVSRFYKVLRYFVLKLK